MAEERALDVEGLASVQRNAKLQAGAAFVVGEFCGGEPRRAKFIRRRKNDGVVAFAAVQAVATFSA